MALGPCAVAVPGLGMEQGDGRGASLPCTGEQVTAPGLLLRSPCPRVVPVSGEQQGPQPRESCPCPGLLPLVGAAGTQVHTCPRSCSSLPSLLCLRLTGFQNYMFPVSSTPCRQRQFHLGHTRGGPSLSPGLRCRVWYSSRQTLTRRKEGQPCHRESRHPNTLTCSFARRESRAACRAPLPPPQRRWRRRGWTR